MGRSHWAPEDHTDFNIQPDLVRRACAGCALANKDMRGSAMNDCARCIESGWQVKKKFKAAKRSKASQIIPDKDLLAGVRECKDDLGLLVEHLQVRKLPELARLAKLLKCEVAFGSTKDIYINEIVERSLI